VSDFRVEVLGYAELAAGSKTLFRRIGEAAPDAFEEVADKVARDVDPPRRTGDLASSVKASREGDSALVSMGEGVPYARFVEYGGRGHPHSALGNYLNPAALDAEPLVVAAGEEAAEDEIGGMSWPSPG
jgi:phage gpG-like protein